MFSELEQTESLIQTGAVAPEEIPAMEALARELETHINPLGGLEEIHPEVLPRDELYYVISRYLDNARLLCEAAPPHKAAVQAPVEWPE